LKGDSFIETSSFSTICYYCFDSEDAFLYLDGFVGVENFRVFDSACLKDALTCLAFGE